MHFVSVFCHGTAGNINSLFLQDLHHGLVALGRPWIFIIDDFPDQSLDALGRDPFSAAAVDTTGKEILDFKDPPGALHVFPIDGTTHCGFVDPYFVGDLFQRQGLQILGTVIEEVFLVFDHGADHIKNGLFSLLDAPESHTAEFSRPVRN